MIKAISCVLSVSLLCGATLGYCPKNHAGEDGVGQPGTAAGHGVTLRHHVTERDQASEVLHAHLRTLSVAEILDGDPEGRLTPQDWQDIAGERERLSFAELREIHPEKWKYLPKVLLPHLTTPEKIVEVGELCRHWPDRYFPFVSKMDIARMPVNLRAIVHAKVRALEACVARDHEKLDAADVRVRMQAFENELRCMRGTHVLLGFTLVAACVFGLIVEVCVKLYTGV